MRGTDALTGKPLSGLAHLRQSIADILRTPLGSRVLRRGYGSGVMALTDAPLNRDTIVSIIAETASALARWEPRIAVSRVRVNGLAPGHVIIDIEGKYLTDGSDVSVSVSTVETIVPDTGIPGASEFHLLVNQTLPAMLA